MPSTSRRNFTLADVMVLVVAVAIALALALYHLRGSVLSGGLHGPATTTTSGYIRYSDIWVKSLVPALMMVTLALLGLRFRPPRPRFRRLAKQPGTITCGAAALVLAIRLAAYVVGWILLSRFFSLHWDGPSGWQRSILTREYPGLAMGTGFAVAVTWLLLALSGLWRPAADWIDRAGRLLGIIWISLIIYFGCLNPTYWDF